MALSLRRRLPLLLALPPLAAVVFVWWGSSFLLAPERRALEPRHRAILARPADYGLALEPFVVRSADGIDLRALLAAPAARPGVAEKTRRMAARLGRSVDGSAPPRGTAFLLHGRGGMKEDLLAVAERFVAGGYRCVLYDARCHGGSGGRYCTFGARESEDFTAVIDRSLALLERRGEAPGSLCAFGISLGAAVLLQSLPDETRLDAAVAVAPFARLPEVALHSARHRFHPSLPSWLVAASLGTGGLRAGFDPWKDSPIRAAGRIRTPLLLVHGSLDAVIPAEHSERLLSKAKGPKKLVLVADGDHGNVLAKGGDELYEQIVRFCLGAAGLDPSDSAAAQDGQFSRATPPGTR